MKNFNQLTIGDVIYKVWANYESKTKPKIEEILVKNISFKPLKGGTENMVLVNENYDSYHGKYWYNFQIPLNESDQNKVENEKDGYFTTDKSVLNDILKQVALSHIEDHKQRIETIEKEIYDVRKAYWEYLNPSSVVFNEQDNT